MTFVVTVGPGETLTVLMDGTAPSSWDEVVWISDDCGDILGSCLSIGDITPADAEVTNETDAVTLSVHTYGRHINHTNRSQFDLETGEKKLFMVRVAK